MEGQGGLFDGANPDPLFEGGTYDPWLDANRLQGQLRKVYEALATGRWYTLAELARLSGGSEAGVSARIRDLRKDRFGGHVVESRRVDERGLWEYRMVLSRPGEKAPVDWTQFER